MRKSWKRISRKVVGLLAFSVWSVSAQERITFLIPTEPEGAIVQRNAEQWGTTGQEFSVDKRKLPTRGNLELQIFRKNYQPHSLAIPSSKYLYSGGKPVRYPESPITLTPNNALVPIQENPLPYAAGLLGVLGILAGAWTVSRRNKQLKKSLEDRDTKEARLRDQIRDQHEFAFSILGPYRVLDQLGEGGIARVYRAVPDEDLDESKAVAMKILHPHLCEEEGHRERFIREGRVSQELIHPNIIRLYEIDSEEQVVYLVLELLKGRTLKEEMGGKRVPLSRVQELIEQILRALVYAHSRGVVHRDLTPSNIMVTESGPIKLMDFGLARSREVGHTVTVTGVIQGTPGYMAPEQLTETLDARTDQYSLGVVMFEMLTGRRPIEREDPMQLIMATYTEEAPDPREFNEDIPEPVAEFILKLLRREPGERFETMEKASQGFHSAFQGVS